MNQKNNFKVMINDHEWTIKFVEKEEDSRLTSSMDGGTVFGTFEMLVLKELPPKTKKLVLMHELTHAYLCSQGRGCHKSLSAEDVCEFVAYCSNSIIEKADYIISEHLKEEAEDNLNVVK